MDISAHLRMFQGKSGAPAYDLESTLTPFRLNMSFWHASVVSKLVARVVDQQQQRVYSLARDRDSLEHHSLWCKHRLPVEKIAILVQEAKAKKTDGLCTRPWWLYALAVVKRSLIFAKADVKGGKRGETPIPFCVCLLVAHLNSHHHMCVVMDRKRPRVPVASMGKSA